jgi:DNA polymerase-3 subunit epsilon
MLANGAQAHIDQMLKKTSAEQWLPLNLEKTVIDKLPSKPGVYYFHNNKDKIIYVGKAVNLKKRVSSHFTQNDADQKRQNFIRNIFKVSYKQCSTELEAIVLESTEIKRIWPRYNRSQKQPLVKYGLYSFEDNRGYIRLAIDRKKKNIQPMYSFNLLHEGQVLLKKMIEEFELNEKLCFLDKTPFTQKEQKLLEPPVLYNVKIKKALESLSEKLPTFVLVDEGITAEEKLCLLIERGSFWGMGYLPRSFVIGSTGELKNFLNPYADNDYIRNSIYSFAEANPDKRIALSR